MTKVKNVNGSSRFPAPRGYNSWLEYWEKQTGQRKFTCGAAGCRKTDLVGAHVQKVDSQDKKWYIVPLCKSCNKKDKPFNVDDDMLVPVPSNI